MGVFDRRAIYLLYNGILNDLAIDSGNVLTGVILDKLPKHNGPCVIYQFRDVRALQSQWRDGTYSNTGYGEVAQQRTA